MDWTQKISDAKGKRDGKPIHYNEVRSMIGDIKSLMKRESNPEVRKSLASAGLQLSKILLR